MEGNKKINKKIEDPLAEFRGNKSEFASGDMTMANIRINEDLFNERSDIQEFERENVTSAVSYLRFAIPKLFNDCVDAEMRGILYEAFYCYGAVARLSVPGKISIDKLVNDTLRNYTAWSTANARSYIHPPPSIDEIISVVEEVSRQMEKILKKGLTISKEYAKAIKPEVDKHFPGSRGIPVNRIVEAIREIRGAARGPALP